MALTNQAPWRRRRLSKDEFRTVIVNQVSSKACWRCSKYLGSMLTFDFGGKVSIPSFRGGVIEAGETTLGIRDCYWKLLKNGHIITDSDSITDETAAELLACMRGAKLCDFVVSESGYADFLFSNNMTLSLDTTNRYDTQDHIAHLTTSDGRIYEVTPRGYVYLSDKVSVARFAQSA